MRPGQNTKRMRGRPNNNRKGPNPLTRSYESSGPDVKIRGTAHHIGEKYLQLARDAQSSGDPVMAESYLQHAEHYFRLIAVAQQAQQQSASGYQRQPGDAGPEEAEGDDFESIPDRFASPVDRFAPPAQPSFPSQPGQGAPQPAERPFYGAAQERQGFERPDRGPRQDRPFQERAYADRAYPDRAFADRPGRDQDSRGQDSRGQDSRGQRGPRAPRDFRSDSQPRNEPRGEPRPTDEIERAALPAFITAPVRAEPEALASAVSAERLAPSDDQPEANGFHLRPRRRRRTKSEIALDQASGSNELTADDPVAD